MRKAFIAVMAVMITAATILMTGCNEKAEEPSSAASSAPSSVSSSAPPSAESSGGQNPVATIEMENGGKIVIELYPDMAPNTVNNFIALAQSGFYDGLVFHRIIPGFVIQGGDPDGNGTGGPGYGIKGEFSENGFTQNTLGHEEGVISMARAGDPNSAGSQFFICDGDCRGALDNKYAGFGKVTEGMDVVHEIANGPNGGGNASPALDPQAMKSVTVDTFGVEYPKPETIPE